MEKKTLISHLPILKDYLTFRDGLDSDSVRVTGMSLEQLPYCLDNAYYSILQVVRLQQDIAKTLKEDLPSDNLIRRILESSERDPIAFMIDSFLDSARRTQNALIPYLSRGLSISLPNSMDDLMKNLDKEKVSLPSSIEKQLKSYWHGHGKKLKDYRDLAQHHALVSSEGYIFRASDGAPCIYLALPNNPEEKSIARLKYNDPVIHAFLYALVEFTKLLAISYRITYLLLPSEVNRNQYAETLFPRNNFFSESMPGQVIRSEKAVEEEITQCLERQANWSSEQSSDQRPPFNPNYVG
jgi:hypothetical protein